MRTDRMARSFLRQALYRLGGVERAIGDRHRLVRISADLRQDREPAFYGDEAGDRTPDELYGEADARRASADATFVVDHVREALPTDESS
jgi:HEPN domain-containing protein